MFLTRGQPVVYSGDEQGFTGPGGDKDARQDMFATQVGGLPRRRPDRHRPHPRERPLRHRRTRSTGRSPRWARCARPTRRCATACRSPGTPPTGPGVFASSRIDPAEAHASTSSRSTTPTTAQTVTFDTWSPGATFQRHLRRRRRRDRRRRRQADRHRPGAVGGRATGPAQPSPCPRPRRPSRSPRRPPAPGADPDRARPPTTTGDPLATVTFAAQVGNGRGSCWAPPTARRTGSTTT